MAKKTHRDILHFFLKWIVNLMIKNGIGFNVGKFKKGDLVVYNWRAQVMIWSVVKDHQGILPVAKVIEYRNSREQDTDGIEFPDLKYGGTTGSDAFWLRKATNEDVVFFKAQRKTDDEYKVIMACNIMVAQGWKCNSCDLIRPYDMRECNCKK